MYHLAHWKRDRLKVNLVNMQIDSFLFNYMMCLVISVGCLTVSIYSLYKHAVLLSKLIFKRGDM